MIRIADINDVGMYHVREWDWFFQIRRQVVHELQRVFVQYILVLHVLILHILKKNYCERYCEWYCERKWMRKNAHGNISIKSDISFVLNTWTQSDFRLGYCVHLV